MPDLVAFSLNQDRYSPASVSDVARYRPGKPLRGVCKKLRPYRKMSVDERHEEYTARNELVLEHHEECTAMNELVMEPPSDSEGDLPQCSAPLVLS